MVMVMVTVMAILMAMVVLNAVHTFFLNDLLGLVERVDNTREFFTERKTLDLMTDIEETGFKCFQIV